MLIVSYWKSFVGNADIQHGKAFEGQQCECEQLSSRRSCHRNIERIQRLNVLELSLSGFSQINWYGFLPVYELLRGDYDYFHRPYEYL